VGILDFEEKEMIAVKLTRALLVCSIGVSVFLSSGCATKKHVRTSIEPLEKRIGQLESKATETEKSIAGLEQGVSRADERARGADARAGQAAQEAARANDRAVKSGEQAESASKAAAGAMTAVDQRATELDSRFDARIRGLENYAVAGEESVLFTFGRSDLNDEAKQTLDALAAKMQPLKRYVVEVQGFTDRSGSAEYNLELSRRRAQSVVRYMTVQHKIPLHRVQLLGVGSELPAADNKTSEGRKQNRRVEVKIYSADEALTGKKVEARLTGGN
jgi:outer membrane protein OmpA-like peptidoglycan-associated protein